MRTALTIAGSDPSGGAGIQADLLAFERLGVRGLSAVTALTAQDGRRVRAVMAVPPSFLTRQLSILLEVPRPDALKIGMIGSAANARAIGRAIGRYSLENVVLDTVIRSTGGRPLIGTNGVEEMRALFPLARVVTPNLVEAAALAGMKRISSSGGMEEAARRLHGLGARNVLVKGGHLEGAPIDLLFDGRTFLSFRGRRMKGPAERFHGTGCMLSAAIAAYLATGSSLEEAVGKGREYLLESLTLRRHR